MIFDLSAVHLDDAELDLYIAIHALGEYARKTGLDVTLIVDREVVRRAE